MKKSSSFLVLVCLLLFLMIVYSMYTTYQDDKTYDTYTTSGISIPGFRTQEMINIYNNLSAINQSFMNNKIVIEPTLFANYSSSYNSYLDAYQSLSSINEITTDAVYNTTLNSFVCPPERPIVFVKDGKILCTTNDTSTPIDCKISSEWEPWSTCNATATTQNRSRIVTFNAVNNGTCSVPTEQRYCTVVNQLNKTQQISGSACNPASARFTSNLTQAQIDNPSYSYGIVKINDSIDGMFVKGGCRAKFTTDPNGTPINCSSHDYSVSYCVPKGEVFHIKKTNGAISKEESESVCAMYNSRVANQPDMRTVIQHEGDWCNSGWVDSSSKTYYPNQTVRNNCGNEGSVQSWSWLPGRIIEKDSDANTGVNCYGKRPNAALSDHEILPFSQTKTSMYD